MEQSVIYSVDDRNIATVTLNRADKHNAFNDEMIIELTRLFKKAGEDENVRALILRAEGKSFSAGADLNWMKKMASYTEAQNESDALALATMLQTLYKMPKPTIARVQGAAFGGAVGLIACCDIAIGSKLSKFCLSEVKIGLIPATISPYVVEAMGARVCRRYFQTAEVFSARRARRLGLLSESVTEDELDSTIDDILSNILKNGPQAVAKAKDLVQWVSTQEIDDALLIKTSKLIAQVRTSDEGQEGLSAFLEKRSASWVEVQNDK
ncbi:enoyl-CoA hydratase/isomerase family protein [Alteromonas sp. BL110]|uniref:enoyl-CoA hydratase/isomerase family protein n=1 Tax=Alteromonas sp. BL110 TaxID=1714845 RepID=UPI000E54CB6E|nr:enoyl-CoA hydratase/isomerase family protein [Alteromonas sp. BL110]AXT40681.1 enoyl-CoA hydratase/isomerase family protein [Alteromonas sp. BL110]RKM79917.1 enoyl-CoA hydratase/isomerase family protein [Alteromonas sp. BL110]